MHRLPNTLSLLASGALGIGALALGPALLGGTTLSWRGPGVPELGFYLSFVVDQVGWLFGLLITGIGSLILLYARDYMKEEKRQGFFYISFMLFLVSMLGVVVSDNLLLLLFFWELTSVSSFLLIGFWNDRPGARQGAFKAFFITSAGGLGLLGALLLLGEAGGTFEISALIARKETLAGHPWTPWILIGLFFGIFTKSAQWPFHIWLPHAMEAPTPVSAFLHAATMVKAGVFLLARFFPLYGDHALWMTVVTATGLITLAWASYQALKQHDLKAILAYSTVSQLGLLTSLYGAGTWAGVSVNTFHILTHACYKGSLFLLVGIIDHATGTRDIRRLRGLYPHLPATGLCMALAAFSMSGLPPFMGFMSKELVLEAGFDMGRSSPWLWVHPAAVALSAALTVAYSLKIVHGVFWGSPRALEAEHIHAPSLAMMLPPALLAGLGLLLGLWPGLIDRMLTVPQLGLPPASIHLALWHGLNPALFVSAAAITAGVLLYRRTGAVDRWTQAHHSTWTFHQLYDGIMDGLVRLAAVVTRATLPRTVTSAVTLTLGLLVATGWAAWASIAPRAISASGGAALRGLPLLAMALILGALAGLLFAKDRLAKVIWLGVIGFLVTLLFALQAAPDLALTQFLIEAVMLILFILALRRMPDTRRPWRTGLGGAAAGGAAALAGLSFGLMCWQMLAHRSSTSVASYFIDHAKATAGGSNIVNVILVDFRGYDTLGEITVVGIAALGVYSLLKRRKAES